MRISDWSSDVCSSDRADDRHDDILGQRLGDRREGAADDDTDREVDDIAAGDKFPEFIQHLVVPRIVELRHRNCRDDCTKASGFLLWLLLRQNAAGRSEEQTSELPLLKSTSYAIVCVKKKNTPQ